MKDKLLRIVAVGDKLAIDREARLPGRGAYVHPDGKCVSLSLHRRVWPHALKKGKQLDVTELEKLEAHASHTETAERLMDLS
jgi:predicted RNA-binding protein YlxR (DUF448 family)